MAKKVGSDIEIARAAKMLPIEQVAAKLGIDDKHLYRYGPNKAKVSFEFINGLQSKPEGKLNLVTAITPTPAGEAKSTTTVGLGVGQALVQQVGELVEQRLVAGLLLSVVHGAAVAGGI